jgi:hypothetical protein
MFKKPVTSKKLSSKQNICVKDGVHIMLQTKGGMDSTRKKGKKYLGRKVVERQQKTMAKMLKDLQNHFHQFLSYNLC